MANGTPAPAAFNINDDEIDAIAVPNRPAAVTSTTAPAATTTATTTVTDDGVSFDDEGIGETVKASDGLQTVKISKGEVARFAFVPSTKIKKALVHYIAGPGTVRCLSTPEKQEACCAKSIKPATDKFAGLVFRYTNIDPKTGKFITGATVPVVEVQAVRLSRSNMRDCLDACEDGQSVYDLDLRMKHDDSRAFGYKFSRAGSKTAWKSIEAEALALTVPYADGTKLASRLGKRLNSIELAAMFASGSNNSEPANMEKLMADLDSD